MIKWGFFYLYYPQYQLIFLVIENFRSILEAQQVMLAYLLNNACVTLRKFTQDYARFTQAIILIPNKNVAD